MTEWMNLLINLFYKFWIKLKNQLQMYFHIFKIDIKLYVYHFLGFLLLYVKILNMYFVIWNVLLFKS